MDNLLKELPRIGRMRFWRLYGRDGSRFLDLRFLDGAGFLGAKGIKALTWAKNALDRGLVKAAPDAYQERLERSIAKRFGADAKAFLFRDCERALIACSRATGREIRRDSLFDPALRSTVEPKGAPGAVDRPFLDEAQARQVAEAPFILVPPALPAPLGCAALVSRDRALSERLSGDTLEGISTFPSARAFDDRELMSREYGAALYRKADKRLAPWFERRGPYLYARVETEAAYTDFRRAALAGGVLLSQDYFDPSILPLDFDDGELTKLVKALAQ